MNKWQSSSGCLLLLPRCQRPIHHPLTLCVCVCVRRRREEEERTSKGPQCNLLVHHPHRPNFRSGGKRVRRNVFSERCSLPFPRLINEAKRCSENSREPLRVFEQQPPPLQPDVGGGDRAFSLEIITFTLLMYGQTTEDTHCSQRRDRRYIYIPVQD